MKTHLSWLLLVAWSGLAATAGAQAPVEAHPCVQKDGRYTCDLAGFKKILAAARTVSVHVPSHDVSAATQLADFARSLGKTLHPSPADLTFEFTRPDPDGLYYGPSDRELATISIYRGGSQDPPGELVWVETYSGQPDTPAATVTHAIIEQLRRDTQ